MLCSNEAACHRGAYEGRRDLYVESLYEYGMRAGLPRVLKIFQEFGWSFSTWMNARALEAASYYGPHFVAGGHDIAAHGNRWITQTELSGPEEEARHVAQAIDRLRAATGLQDVPTGWYYGRGTLYNKHILAKASCRCSLLRRTSLTPRLLNRIGSPRQGGASSLLVGYLW